MKTCPDCKKRGDWKAQRNPDTCEECSAKRFRDHELRRDVMKRCANNPGRGCDPKSQPICASCADYFASDTHRSP